MNKHQRAEIKTIIMTQIDALSEELPTLDKTPGVNLRLRRLETALMRIDADNFGECFKCGRAIQMSSLKNHPEKTICDACLEGAMAPVGPTFPDSVLRLLAVSVLLLAVTGYTRHPVYVNSGDSEFRKVFRGQRTRSLR
jgi:hypothetical protein